MRYVGYAVATLFVLVILWGLGTAFGIIGGAAERIGNPDRMVGVYERFFDRCASVQALENQRMTVRAELDETDDPERRERLLSSLQAIEAQRARTITQYNADADAPTRSFLKSEGLPAELNHEDEWTECAR